MKKSTFCACLCALVLLLPTSAFAATFINADGDVPSGTWDEEGSPYIIDGNIWISGRNNSLTIGPGVSIMAASTSVDTGIYGAGSIINIQGTADKPVRFYDMGAITLADQTTSVSNAEFYRTQLQVTRSTTTLDHISFNDSDYGLVVTKSLINANNLSFSSTTKGIWSKKVSMSPVLMDAYQRALSRFLSFFLPNRANAQIADDPNQNHITVHDSSFDNTQYAVYNDTPNTIHAEDNWWGSDAGPRTDPAASVNAIYGPVSYDPWQGKETAHTCCSSILFVPGFEGSRLSVDNRRVLGTSTSQLWEPISNLQVKNLYLDSSGNSIQSNIHPSGLVDTALAVVPIYQKFIGTMKDLVAKGTITEWQPFPYDWRLPLTKVATGMIGTSTALQEIEQMASTSKTGKVTIIAHSNGGLVTKLLYNQLKDKGEASLVDKIIFVAVPEIGTPQALPSLLHGDAQQLAGGLILSASTARGLGVNMPSAYSLLPDQDYFKLVPQAIISFASSTMAGLNFSKYFPVIASYSKMKSFIGDSSHGVLSGSTNIPVKGNAGLFSQAESVHSTLDDWKPATSTELVAIAGWGLPTDVGINYFQKIVCVASDILHLGKKCSSALQYSDINDIGGDSTVDIRSALYSSSYSSSTKKIFDEGAFDKENSKTLAHADILEADPVISTITSTIQNNQPVASIPYIYDTIPTRSLGKELTIGIHSPATIDIYDKAGNHTGPIDNPIPGSDFDAYENKIPGSFYREEGDQVYVILPFSSDYSVDINGTGIGEVEVTTELKNSDTNEVIASSTFEDIPVTPITHMEFAAGTSTNEIDSYKVIKIDENGDGVFDATSTPDVTPTVTADMYKDSFRNCIHALQFSSADEKILLSRLDKAWKFAANDKSGKAEKAFMNLTEKRIHHIKIGKINDRNRTEMRSMIEGMMSDMGV